jgi:hypothetical protein
VCALPVLFLSPRVTGAQQKTKFISNRVETCRASCRPAKQHSLRSCNSSSPRQAPWTSLQAVVVRACACKEQLKSVPVAFRQLLCRKSCRAARCLSQRRGGAQSGLCRKSKLRTLGWQGCTNRRLRVYNKRHGKREPSVAQCS